MTVSSGGGILYDGVMISKYPCPTAEEALKSDFTHV